MSSPSERPPGIRSWLAGGLLLAASLYLLSVYAEGQLGHTVRFLFEVLVYRDRIFPF